MDGRPKRKTEHLLKGRVSIPHARYFITLCTKEREIGLTETLLAELIEKVWRTQHRDGDYCLHCATIMPDHVHWLCTLGTRLTLSQTIGKFKSMAQVRMDWQRNYYDHRLRAEDAIEPFGKYIFLNPYRKRLIRCNELWPWWTLNRNFRPEFVEHLIDGRYPPREWIARSTGIADLISADTNAEWKAES